MNIIAFDTAADVFSLALKAGERRYFLEIGGGQKHSELIMDAAEALTRLAGLSKEDLSAAACMEGPGSFTGLRIGFAAAKGLALARGIPLIPVPTLDCAAAPLSFWPGPVMPVMDAKKNAFFAALYWGGERISPYMDAGPNALAAALAAALADRAGPAAPGGAGPLLTGPGAGPLFPLLAPRFPGLALDPAHARARGMELLTLAEQAVIRDCTARGPLYLRKSDAELNGPPGAA
ncbi:MAG: tRNA (adenosine(37)-N6)-threonylcarbamoyltransferase complex dimerization subunit type 1 TsaB [Treponema sp.]|nr:tRNA (adenosine(37)-N6)-threonylcarbamoyltransferase complex dimerization subunit type 1 TsaB [Treponema sp.]